MRWDIKKDDRMQWGDRMSEVGEQGKIDQREKIGYANMNVKVKHKLCKLCSSDLVEYSITVLNIFSF